MTSSCISCRIRFASAVRMSVVLHRLYAKNDGVSVAPAWLEDRGVIAVFENGADPKPSYTTWLEWRDGRISFIRHYRYVRYLTADAEVTLAPHTRNVAEGGAA
jgi:hypothetical protein